MTYDYKINNCSYTWENPYFIDMIGLNAAKNTNYIENSLKQKLRRIKFPEKISFDAFLYLHHVWS